VGISYHKQIRDAIVEYSAADSTFSKHHEEFGKSKPSSGRNVISRRWEGEALLGFRLGDCASLAGAVYTLEL
jgi:hypothetical protein